MKCITFDKAAQDALPEKIKAQMRYDRAVARKTLFECCNCKTISTSLNDADDGDEITAGYCVKCDHPVWWAQEFKTL